MRPSIALASLPERFQQQPRTEVLDAYISAKYSKSHPIEYNPEFSPEKSRERYRWVENVTDGLRFVDRADKIIRLDHTGYYTDNWQDETVHGEVYQLPSRNGSAQYVPAVNDPCNENCACVDFTSVIDDKENAARSADSMAEHWAESEREYRAKEDAEQRLEDIDAEIKDHYQEFRRVAREIRANCDQLKGIAVIRELIHEKWEHTKADIHKLRAERSRIEDHGIDYY